MSIAIVEVTPNCVLGLGDRVSTDPPFVVTAFQLGVPLSTSSIVPDTERRVVIVEVGCTKASLEGLLLPLMIVCRVALVTIQRPGAPPQFEWAGEAPDGKPTLAAQVLPREEDDLAVVALRLRLEVPAENVTIDDATAVDDTGIPADGQATEENKVLVGRMPVGQLGGGTLVGQIVDALGLAAVRVSEEGLVVYPRRPE